MTFFTRSAPTKNLHRFDVVRLAPTPIRRLDIAARMGLGSGIAGRQPHQQRARLRLGFLFDAFLPLAKASF
jgi:hypothetical protein